MKVVGYSDVLSVEAGGRISFMVSCESPEYEAEVVRLIHGSTDPRGPGYKRLAVETPLTGTHAGRVQELRPGSFARFEGGDWAAGESFTFCAWIWPTTPEKAEQTLIAVGDRFALRLDAGTLVLVVGGAELRLERPLLGRTWYSVLARYDAGTGLARLALEPLRAVESLLAASAEGPLPPPAGAADEVTLAADGRGGRLYNGKIAAPVLYVRAVDGADAPDPAARWDLSLDIQTAAVTDVSGGEHHGVTVQRPTRAVTGPRWDGTETAWRHAPHMYDAVHFHDDDLDDAGWEADLAWDVPTGTRSGVYALLLRSGDAVDHVPFAVRPPRGEATARIAFLMPTFSYLAYANEQMLTLQGMSEQTGVSDAIAEYPSSPEDRYAVGQSLRSTYDVHGDGSGVCYSSRLRPLVNMRPSYEMAVLGTPHQFAADLMLVDWLHESGYEVDVVTDDDLHAEGAALLRPYNVVLSGSHCEYWSGAMLDGMEEYLCGGGRFLYLSGNGMYWVAERDPVAEHTIEVRRRGPGTRTWEPEPGEAHLSTTGELGGLWRYRGRAPQSWAGVGFTAAGGESPGRPFERSRESHEPRVAWIFDGVGDEPIGDTPSLIIRHGAAAQEVDRMDHALGTPSDAILLATASGFSDVFQHVVEEVFQTNPNEGGTESPLVRADMVLVPYPNGGAVFSASSIAWSGCLSYGGYDNAVSRVMRNVVDRFVEEGDWDCS